MEFINPIGEVRNRVYSRNVIVITDKFLLIGLPYLGHFEEFGFKIIKASTFFFLYKREALFPRAPLTCEYFTTT